MRYPYRLTLLVPAARRDAVNAWLRANLDPAGGDWLTYGLSPTGEAPPSHYLASSLLSEAHLRRLAEYIASVTTTAANPVRVPVDWDTGTKRARRRWWVTHASRIATRTGIRMRVTRNREEPPLDQWLSALNLQPVRTEEV